MANPSDAHRLRLALIQDNATVGDLRGNAELVVSRSAAAVQGGADLVVFPEMFLTGYPVEDLALRKSFIDASRAALETLADRLGAGLPASTTVVVGYLDAAQDHVDRLGRPRHSPQNAAAVIRGGQVMARYAKHHLPNYGVFDEYRYFVPGAGPCVVEVAGHRVAVVICEDLWQDGGPVAWAKEAGAELLVVINGSPYERDKDDARLELCARRSREAGMPLAYVNLVGGQDELVFDGDSLVVDAAGAVMARAAQFTAEISHGRSVRRSSHFRRTTPSRRCRRGVSSPGPGFGRLRPQERVQLRPARPLRWHRLLADRRDRRGRYRRRAVFGISHAERYYSAPLARTTPPIWPADRPELPRRTDRRDGARLHGQLGLTGLAEENLQARVRAVV